MSYGKTMEAIIKDKELKAYEKGVRDMWGITKYNCRSATMEFDGSCVGFDKDDNCDIDVCPIARELLKGVGK